MFASALEDQVARLACNQRLKDAAGRKGVSSHVVAWAESAAACVSDQHAFVYFDAMLRLWQLDVPDWNALDAVREADAAHGGRTASSGQQPLRSVLSAAEELVDAQEFQLPQQLPVDDIVGGGGDGPPAVARACRTCRGPLLPQAKQKRGMDEATSILWTCPACDKERARFGSVRKEGLV